MITTQDLLAAAWAELPPRQRNSQELARSVERNWCILRDEYIDAMRQAILNRISHERLERVAFSVYAHAVAHWGWPFTHWELLEEANFTAHLMATLRYLHQEYHDTAPLPPLPSDEEIRHYAQAHTIMQLTLF